MAAADRAMYQAKKLGKNQISGNPRPRPALLARRSTIEAEPAPTPAAEPPSMPTPASPIPQLLTRPLWHHPRPFPRQRGRRPRRVATAAWRPSRTARSPLSSGRSSRRTTPGRSGSRAARKTRRIHRRSAARSPLPAGRSTPITRSAARWTRSCPRVRRTPTVGPRTTDPGRQPSLIAAPIGTISHQTLPGGRMTGSPVSRVRPLRQVVRRRARPVHVVVRVPRRTGRRRPRRRGTGSGGEATGIELAGQDVLAHHLDDDGAGADPVAGHRVDVRHAAVGPQPALLVVVPLPTEVPEADDVLRSTSDTCAPPGSSASSRNASGARTSPSCSATPAGHPPRSRRARRVDVEIHVVRRAPHARRGRRSPSPGEPVRVRHAVGVEPGEDAAGAAEVERQAAHLLPEVDVEVARRAHRADPGRHGLAGT